MKDKTKKAVALDYRPGYTAPKVVAKGQGHLAERIIDTAKAENVPLHYNPELVKELTAVELGANIPPELYEVVAQVLVFVSDLDKLSAMRQ